MRSPGTLISARRCTSAQRTSVLPARLIQTSRGCAIVATSGMTYRCVQARHATAHPQDGPFPLAPTFGGPLRGDGAQPDADQARSSRQAIFHPREAEIAVPDLATVLQLPQSNRATVRTSRGHACSKARNTSRHWRIPSARRGIRPQETVSAPHHLQSVASAHLTKAARNREHQPFQIPRTVAQTEHPGCCSDANRATNSWAPHRRTTGDVAGLGRRAPSGLANATTCLDEGHNIFHILRNRGIASRYSSTRYNCSRKGHFAVYLFL